MKIQAFHTINKVAIPFLGRIFINNKKKYIVCAFHLNHTFSSSIYSLICRIGISISQIDKLFESLLLFDTCLLLEEVSFQNEYPGEFTLNCLSGEGHETKYQREKAFKTIRETTRNICGNSDLLT